MPNLVCRFSCIVRRRLKTIYDLRFTTNQSGIAQVLLLLFLLAGIGIGTLIVQNRTNFFPRADCNPGIDNNCDTGGGSEEGDPQGQEDAEKKEEQQDLERGAREAGKSVDEYKKDDCKANPGKKGCDEILSNTKKNEDAKNNDKESSAKQADPKKDCDNISYCQGGKVVRKFANDFSSDGSCNYRFITMDPSEDNGCSGDKHKDGDLISSVNISSTGHKAAGEIALTTSQKATNEASAAEKDKAAADDLRKKLDPEGKFFDAALSDDPAATEGNVNKCIQAKYGDPNRLGDNLQSAEDDCVKYTKLIRNVSDAQTAYDNITNSSLTDVSLSAAYTDARLRYRSSACDAATSNIPGANCVLDLGDRENIIKAKVKTSTGSTEEVRIFVGCSTLKSQNDSEGRCRKVLNYRDPKTGNIVELDPEIAKKPRSEGGLGIADSKNIYDISQLPADLLKSAKDLCSATSQSCITASSSQPEGLSQDTKASNATVAKAAGNESQNADTCKSFSYNQGSNRGACSVSNDGVENGFVCQLSDKRYNDSSGKSFIQKFRENDPDKFANCGDDQIINYWCNQVGQRDCAVKKSECSSAGICTGTSESPTKLKAGKDCTANNQCESNVCDPNTKKCYLRR